MLGNFVGNAAETTIAAAHLVFGGVLERHPGLRVCLVHGGGFAPYQAARMDHGYGAEPRLVDKRLSRPPSDYLRKLYFDTVTHSPEVLRFLIDFAGREQVVLGNRLPVRDGRRRTRSAGRTDAGPDAEEQNRSSGKPRAALAGVRREEWGDEQDRLVPVTDGHPHFSAGEMPRRHEAILAAADEAGVSRVLSIGSNRNGSAVQWLTGWPVTRDGLVFTEAGGPTACSWGSTTTFPRPASWPATRRSAGSGPVPVETVLETLAARGHQGQPLGLVGPVSAHLHRSLTGAGIEVVDLNRRTPSSGRSSPPRRLRGCAAAPSSPTRASPP